MEDRIKNWNDMGLVSLFMHRDKVDYIEPSKIYIKYVDVPARAGQKKKFI